MSDSPWSAPNLSIDERLCHVLEHTFILDARNRSVPGAVAILREAFRAIEADAHARGKAEASPVAHARPFGRDPTADSDAARFRAMAEQGKTGKDIAAELGVSYPRVVRLLHKSGFFKDKAARREALIREGATAVARGETTAAAAARLGVKPGWLGAVLEDYFRHDHPRVRGATSPGNPAPCLWCGHPHVYSYMPSSDGYSPWDRCHERVKAIARGDEAAMLSDRQRFDRDRNAPTP